MTRRRLTVQVDERVHTSLTMLAEVREVSLQKLAESALAEFVDREFADPHVRAAVQAGIDNKLAALGGA